MSIRRRSWRTEGEEQVRDVPLLLVRFFNPGAYMPPALLDSQSAPVQTHSVCTAVLPAIDLSALERIGLLQPASPCNGWEEHVEFRMSTVDGRRRMAGYRQTIYTESIG